MARLKVAGLFVCTVVLAIRVRGLAALTMENVKHGREGKHSRPACATATEKGATHTHTHPWVATGIITHLLRGRATPTGTAVRTEWSDQKHVYVQLGWHTWVLNTIYDADGNP